MFALKCLHVEYATIIYSVLAVIVDW